MLVGDVRTRRRERVAPAREGAVIASGAKQSRGKFCNDRSVCRWIASSLTLLAMTGERVARNDGGASRSMCTQARADLGARSGAKKKREKPKRTRGTPGRRGSEASFQKGPVSRAPVPATLSSFASRAFIHERRGEPHCPCPACEHAAGRSACRAGTLIAVRLWVRTAPAKAPRARRRYLQARAPIPVRV